MSPNSWILWHSNKVLGLEPFFNDFAENHRCGTMSAKELAGGTAFIFYASPVAFPSIRRLQEAPSGSKTWTQTFRVDSFFDCFWLFKRIIWFCCKRRLYSSIKGIFVCRVMVGQVPAMRDSKQMFSYGSLVTWKLGYSKRWNWRVKGRTWWEWPLWCTLDGDYLEARNL